MNYDVKYVKSDITKETSGFVLHGCNCQGEMGSGVALAIRNRWPEVYVQYKSVCDSEENKGDLLGEILPVLIEGSNDLVVVNCFTQENYGSDGKQYADASAILFCIAQVAKIAKENLNINSKLKVIKMPMIGCGLGGLDWDNDVKPIVELISHIYKIPVEIYYI